MEEEREWVREAKEKSEKEECEEEHQKTEREREEEKRFLPIPPATETRQVKQESLKLRLGLRVGGRGHASCHMMER